MKKRLSRQEKNELFIKDIINKMFEIAGHSTTFDDIKDRKDNWFTEWTMTVEQNEEWKEWGIKEIVKRFRCNKKYAETQMGMISLNWGLKFSNFNSHVGV